MTSYFAKKNWKGYSPVTAAIIPTALYMGADKSLARPGRKQATTTEDFDVHISYLLSQLEEY